MTLYSILHATSHMKVTVLLVPESSRANLVILSGSVRMCVHGWVGGGGGEVGEMGRRG